MHTKQCETCVLLRRMLKCKMSTIEWWPVLVWRTISLSLPARRRRRRALMFDRTENRIVNLCAICDVISVSGVFSPVQTLAHDTAAATKQSARDQPETNAGNLGPDWFDNTSEMSIELFSDWSLCTMHHAHDCHMPIWNQVRLMGRDRFGSFLVIIKLDLSMFFGCCHARRKRLQVFYFDRQ